MIGRLRGVLMEKQPPSLLLDVLGVGYELEAPMSTFYELPPLGSEVTLFTHLAVREDAHLLYAFASASERALFRSLLKVNGVGAKLALTILSGISASDFSRCVQDGDTAALTRLPGVGKKTAERLVIEMRDRLVDLGMPGITLPSGVVPPVTAEPDAVKDAVSALIALGYKPQEASRMVSGVDDGSLASEELIRAALQAVVR